MMSCGKDEVLDARLMKMENQMEYNKLVKRFGSQISKLANSSLEKKSKSSGVEERVQNKMGIKAGFKHDSKHDKHEPSPMKMSVSTDKHLIKTQFKKPNEGQGNGRISLFIN